jgi:hypothetical protein
VWCRTLHVIACDKREAFVQGSACDDAIHVSTSGTMDCFASLAMTLGNAESENYFVVPALGRDPRATYR